jgi:hypothetical protein
MHTARSRLTFIRAARDQSLQIIVRPSDDARFQSGSWWRSRATLRDGLLEWQKLLYYRLVELPRFRPAPASP